MRRRPAFAAAVVRAIAASYRTVAKGISILRRERRTGEAAERMYEQLRRMSDADLAELGIERHQIAQYIKERLY